MGSLCLHIVCLFPYPQGLYFSQLPVELKRPFSEFCALSLNLTILLLELSILSFYLCLQPFSVLLLYNYIIHSCNYTVLTQDSRCTYEKPLPVLAANHVVDALSRCLSPADSSWPPVALPFPPSSAACHMFP